MGGRPLRKYFTLRDRARRAILRTSFPRSQECQHLFPVSSGSVFSAVHGQTLIKNQVGIRLTHQTATSTQEGGRRTTICRGLVSEADTHQKSKLLCSTILRLLMSCFIQRRLSQQLTDRSSSPRGRTGPQTTTYWGCLGEVDTDLTYHRDMAHPVIHISEAEAASDFASVLARVRAGAEVVIESESGKLPVAVIHSPVPPRRSISECIALARKHEEETGESPVLDPDFAADVEEIIHNRKP